MARKKDTIDANIIHKIDNIEDEFDYQPYKAIKKTTITNDELFSDKEYKAEEEKLAEKEDSSSNLGNTLLIVLGILGIAIIGTIAIVLYILKL